MFFTENNESQEDSVRTDRYPMHRMQQYIQRGQKIHNETDIQR